jgi:hypothetical protein
MIMLLSWLVTFGLCLSCRLCCTVQRCNYLLQHIRLQCSCATSNSYWCSFVLQAVLHGPEVQVTAPADEELAGLTGPNSSSSSSTAPGSSSTTSSSSPWTSTGSAAAAGAAAAAAGVSELDKKLSNVLVFEGQTLSWTLNLTNISAQTITGCKVRHELQSHSWYVTMFSWQSDLE